MTRLVATRVSDETYVKIMAKCVSLGCSVYDYLKMVVETDIADTKQTKEMEEKKTQPENHRNATQEDNWFEGITMEDVERWLGNKSKTGERH